MRGESHGNVAEEVDAVAFLEVGSAQPEERPLGDEVVDAEDAAVDGDVRDVLGRGGCCRVSVVKSSRLQLWRRAEAEAGAEKPMFRAAAAPLISGSGLGFTIVGNVGAPCWFRGKRSSWKMTLTSNLTLTSS